MTAFVVVVFVQGDARRRLVGDEVEVDCGQTVFGRWESDAEDLRDGRERFGIRFRREGEEKLG